jgi:hypothetical protein
LAKNGWLGSRIMCPSGVKCLPADCCFSELTEWNDFVHSYSQYTSWKKCENKFYCKFYLYLYFIQTESRWVGNCCLTPNEQFFRYIMTRVSYIHKETKLSVWMHKIDPFCLKFNQNQIKSKVLFKVGTFTNSTNISSAF